MESLWLSQLAEMRSTIADVKAQQMALNGQEARIEYGHNIIADDSEDTLASENEGSDPIWDMGSDDETDTGESTESPPPSETPSTSKQPQVPYGYDWLKSRCQRLSSNTSLSANHLTDQIFDLLISDCSNDEIQATLTDMLGYTDLDFVVELIIHRREICAEPSIGHRTEKTILQRLQQGRQRDSDIYAQASKHDTATAPVARSQRKPQYPHVYQAHNAGNTLSHGNRKYGLPQGSQRFEQNLYEEYSIPASQVGTVGRDQSLIEVESLDGLCRNTFKRYRHLNRMQSLVFPVAYQTSENMLICAPTGAGKTDAALLTILHAIAQNMSPHPSQNPDPLDFTVDKENFKIIYVAPMKALAAEITEKLSQRLEWLGIQARELTGDMHLTKQEILRTQIIVTTPEKWDVVTRKSTGDTELVQKVRLLIIDEVHMLHDERGAVLESLVARTERQVESTQSLIRIVGLSATLPNYIDIADFLKVNRYAGLFYFDASFRPVPLEQHFIGVKGKPNTRQSRENMDQTAFEKVKDMLQQGHQIMVFVHSRKETVSCAKTFIAMAQEQACADLLDCQAVNGYSGSMAKLKQTKGRELRELVPKGFGVHHAGMPRSDRNQVEQLFAQGHINVLCCTATLAWGVNLPAAAVIIKGTQLYSAQEGKFIDLGILDVLQIFGRAGRPQFQSTGIGFICTTHDRLDHYLTAVTQQQPIESRFSAKLVDNLNAEISLGTVTSVPEAVQWLGYSYLFVRMQRNPTTYGIDWAEIRDDPHLVQRRRKLVIDAARILQRSQMVIFNEVTEELRAKDIGRIASQFYVLQSSIEIFNTMMRPQASEADVLKMISMSGEFDNVQSRDSEAQELANLESTNPCDVDGGITSTPAKVNILLQSYISRAKVEDFTLMSDSAYVAQNAARICRAIFMIALNRRWGYQCLVLLSLCKAIERQVWPFQHPFHQFDLPAPILRNLDEKTSSSSIDSLRDMESAEIGQLVHNKGMGRSLGKLLDNFPTLSMEAEIAPLNRDVLRVHLYLFPEFQWNDRHHGTSESYWIWVENSETSDIYHHEYFILSRKRLYDSHELNFTIPLQDPIPDQIYVKAMSDRWLGAETVHAISFQHLIRPDTESVYTDLLDLQPLPLNALRNPLLEHVYRHSFQFFNPMQTQIFHTLYHTSANVLLGSPTGSGKTIAAELAMWWAFRENPGSKVVYIAPMKALVRERVQDWRGRLAGPMGLQLVELTGDNTPDTRSIRHADMIITTPEKWDGISRSWQTRGYVQQVSLVIIDEIHLLGGDRGPILEIIVSRMNYIASQLKKSVRIVGMSTACANATDLGNWLGVKEGLFNFRHSVRPVPLESYIDGFPEQRGFCPLMQSMNRPTFLAIKTHSPSKPVIVFVASRRQTRLTAKDLINFCGMEDNPRRFVLMPEEDLQMTLFLVKDEALREALSFGIGLHHAGLVESDRQLAEQLFANNKIQVLVATSTLAWGVNLPAHLVVIKGTQYYDAKIEGYKDMDLTDVLQMMGRAGRPQFDNSGIARIFTQDSKKEFYKHFLHTGFPVESSLHLVIDNHLGAEVSANTITTKQDALDYLTWTFFFRRLHKNPSYYGLDISTEEQTSSVAQARAKDFMIELVEKSLSSLSESSCIVLSSTDNIQSTPFGRIMSYYYLSHNTIRSFLSSAKQHPTFSDALGWICQATEFDELPVRHNEDLINAGLSNSLPIKTEALGKPMWDPHVKAFLLLQAHFSRIELPISDYVGDLNSVLDQSIRIIQASIDVLAEMRYSSSVRMMISLLQCVKSARWLDDGPLAMLPRIDLAKFRQKSAAEKIRPLQEIMRLSSSSLIRILVDYGISNASSSEISGIIARLPDLDVDISDVNALGMVVTIRRRNRPISEGCKIYAPHFPKPQSEGFFIVATEAGTDNVIALKRINWLPSISDIVKVGKRDLKAKAAIRLEAGRQERIIELKVMSDAYLNLEWNFEVTVPAAPIVVDGGKNKEDQKQRESGMVGQCDWSINRE